MAEEATNAQPMTRRELEEKIVARAWKDDEFRRKFVADPKGQFEEHLGTKLPEALKMTVHEESADSLHFVIPQKPTGNLSELSDEDLEKVAGGVDVATTVATALVTGFLAANLAIMGDAAIAHATGDGWTPLSGA